MLNRRYVLTFSFAALPFVVLLSFQNCAPAPGQVTAQAASDEVRIIDEWNKAQLQFATDDVQVQDDAAVAKPSGLCSREFNGRSLRWALWADHDSSQPLLYGESACQSGQFSLPLTGLENMVCGVPHRLVVEGSWGAVATARLTKRCQPLVSEPAFPPAQSPPGTQCSIEFVPAEGVNSSCVQVCYRDHIVTFHAVLEKSSCSVLAQKLAPPAISGL